MKFEKIVPFILVAAAIIGVVLNYKTYEKLTSAKKCGCQEEEDDEVGPLPD